MGRKMNEENFDHRLEVLVNSATGRLREVADFCENREALLTEEKVDKVSDHLRSEVERLTHHLSELAERGERKKEDFKL